MNGDPRHRSPLPFSAPAPAHGPYPFQRLADRAGGALEPHVDLDVRRGELHALPRPALRQLLDALDLAPGWWFGLLASVSEQKSEVRRDELFALPLVRMHCDT